MPEPLQVMVSAEGTISFVYSDQLQPLLLVGSAQIRRASHVEPDPDGKWYVDLSPSRGPSEVGPFIKRSSALFFEKSWLEFSGLN